ncbi:MAG: hypothetical protein IPI85_17610 [Dehalococcoidia bacterium]|nr:hypothetical protein [Dehalococcoidia bacterium]
MMSRWPGTGELGASCRLSEGDGFPHQVVEASPKVEAIGRDERVEARRPRQDRRRIEQAEVVAAGDRLDLAQQSLPFFREVADLHESALFGRVGDEENVKPFRLREDLE